MSMSDDEGIIDTVKSVLGLDDDESGPSSN